MKMDKRATKILLGCIICTIIVGLLLLVAFRFATLSCELIKVDPQALRHSQLKAFNKDSNKPKRSHDKTMLIKIAAYLEYNIPGSSKSSSTSTTAAPSDSFHSNNNNNQTNQQVGKGPQVAPSNANNNQMIGPANRPGSGPSPSVPQLGFTSNQLHNSSSFVTSPPSRPQGGSTSVNSWLSSQAAAENRAEKRFLPLELDEVETKKLEDNKFRYKLVFNCSTLSMVFVRSPQRVHVESMSLELEPSSRHKSKCDVKMPPVPSMPPAAVLAGHPMGQQQQQHNQTQVGGLFAADNRDGFAHYLGKSPISFRCYHLSSRQSKEMMGQTNGPLLLAELHILALEFETITGTIRGAHVKKEEFKTEPTTTSGITGTNTNNNGQLFSGQATN